MSTKVAVVQSPPGSARQGEIHPAGGRNYQRGGERGREPAGVSGSLSSRLSNVDLALEARRGYGVIQRNTRPVAK